MNTLVSWRLRNYLNTSFLQPYIIQCQAVAAFLLTSTCVAVATPQFLGDWDWNLFAHFPDYYTALFPESKQPESTDLMSAENLLTQGVDHSTTLALVGLVMCLKETRGSMVKTPLANGNLFLTQG